MARSLTVLAIESRVARIALWALLVGQCAAVAWQLHPWMAGDSPSYLELAGNLARGFYGEVLEGRIQPDVLRPPAYPLLLWFLLHVMKLSGGAVIAVQLGAYLLAIYLVERFLRGRNLPGNIFLAVAAVYPFGVVYSAGYMTEPWVMLGYTAAALIVARERVGVGGAVLCGILIGLLGLLRTDMLLMILLAAAILAFRAWRGRSGRLRDLAPPAALLVAAALVLTPYAWWNYSNFGKFSPAPLAAAAGNSLYSAYWQEHLPNKTLNDFYSGRITEPLVRSGYLDEIRRWNATFGAPPLTSPANPINYPDNATRVRTNVVFGKVAVAHFKAEPMTYARHVAKNFWFLWNMSEYPGIPRLAKAGLQLASGLVYLLGILGAGLVLLGRLPLTLPRSLVIFLLYPFVMHVPFHLEARYTAAARPLLMLFAALAVTFLVARWRRGGADDMLRSRWMLGPRNRPPSSATTKHG